MKALTAITLVIITFDVLAGPHAVGTLDGVADAVIDLRTDEGAALVNGAWRYRDARIVEVDHRLPGADRRATGAPNRTHDIAPKVGEPGFDDQEWPIIPASSLERRRSQGRLSFGWYCIGVTIPQAVGAFDPTGSAVVFEIVTDDYAEVWVDARLPLVLGSDCGPAINGWNAPNRVVLTRDARPGQRFDIAVFAANGPLSQPPANYVWIRSATLDFYRPERAESGDAVDVRVIRNDPRLDGVISGSPVARRVATGFGFTEGPAWSDPLGALLFSDPNNNAIYRWTADHGVSVFRSHSGYSGLDIDEYRQPGSNGLAIDAQGRLTICEHGNRRVTRLEANGDLTVLADRHEGRRLNSPNDLVYRSDGALYFTDPPFGLPRVYDDARKELPYCGVFCLIDGELKLVSTDLKGPNGLAFSPDERYLYVGNWDEQHKVIMRYDVHQDGTLSGGRIFFDMTAAEGAEAIDGLKVDATGNVYTSGPGGVWIIAPDGMHLGTLVLPELPANFAWGNTDRRTLCLTARTSVYQLQLLVAGAGGLRAPDAGE